MTVLYFIGNGFDLGIGLETRYSDVLPLYIKEPTGDAVISSFKENIDKNIDTWAGFEEGMGMYTDGIKKKETPIETFLDYQKCMFDFKYFLKNYLKGEENKVKYDNTRYIAETFKSSVLNFKECLNCDPTIIMDKIDKETIKFSYINFNYTTAFDKCLDIFKESNIFPLEKRIKSGLFPITADNDLGVVKHIHGTLDSDMILGVNDLNQIKNTDFRSLEKLRTYIKPNANEALENNKNSDVLKLLKEADIYCIFGMSLGKTDRKWWIEISRQLINSHEKKLIIYAHDENCDTSFPENTLETKDYFKIIFLNHLKFTELDKDDIKEKIKKNIHVVINKNIFKMKLC
jgi:hypothetical protein